MYRLWWQKSGQYVGGQVYKGIWTPRGVIRQDVHKFIGDTGLLDFMLKAVTNTTWNGYCIYRSAWLICPSRASAHPSVPELGPAPSCFPALC